MRTQGRIPNELQLYAPRMSYWSFCIQFVTRELNDKQSVQRGCSPFEAFRGRKNKDSFKVHNFIGGDQLLTSQAHDELINTIHKVTFDSNHYSKFHLLICLL
jgi:hypothetical protein